MHKPTEGQRILVTRSEPGASRLAEILELAGWLVEKYSLVRIEPNFGEEVWRANPALDRCDVLIFTSVHAVLHGFDIVARSRRGTLRNAIWIAVGSATAAALRERQVEPRLPDVERSEGILAMPELQQVRGCSVAIVGGVGGRRVLDAALEARGAEVVRLAVYRRVAAAPGVSLDPAGLAAVEISSIAGAESLAQALADIGKTPAWLAGVPLVVPSARVAEGVSALGFGKVRVSEGAGPAAILAVLETIGEGEHDG